MYWLASRVRVPMRVLAWLSSGPPCPSSAFCPLGPLRNSLCVLGLATSESQPMPHPIVPRNTACGSTACGIFDRL